MSEEEIIKEVDDFIDGYRQYDVKTGETIIPYKYGEGQRFCYKEEYEAIQCLLDLYEKEKEKNALLLANNNGYYDLKEYLKNNYISKDKIKEKIEWYEEACKHLLKNGIDLDRYDQYQGAIEALQEILEEE